MFDNIGSKIKALAEVVCWVGIIGSVFISILMFAAPWNSDKTEGAYIGLGVAILIGGSLVSWISSLICYGFGELIENSGIIARNTATNSRPDKQSQKRTNRRIKRAMQDLATTSSTAYQMVKSTAVDDAKSIPVAELLTNISISELSVSLNELFSSEKCHSIEWIDSDTMVRLIVQRQLTSNFIVFCFSKAGDTLAFPQVSTMVSKSDAGTQEVRWSYDDIDNALIELLLAEGYIVNDCGYKVAR